MEKHHWYKLKKRLEDIMAPNLNISFNYSPLRKKTNWSEITLRFFQVKLDDEILGKEKNSEFVSQTIYQIINIRYEREMPTIITTEGSMCTMTAHYKEKGKAIQSRLEENFILITLDGDDYRQKGR